MGADEVSNGNYQEAWRDLSWRKGAVYAFIIGTIAVVLSDGFLPVSWTDGLWYPVIGWNIFLGLLVATLRWTVFKCPRCGEKFEQGYVGRHLSGRKSCCGNCGLPFGAVTDPGGMEESIESIGAENNGLRRMRQRRSVIQGVVLFLVLLGFRNWAPGVVWPPRQVAEKAILELGRADYTGVEMLATLEFVKQLRNSQFRFVWKSFRKVNPLAGSFVLNHVDRLPRDKVGLVYAAPELSSPGRLAVLLVRQGSQWKLDGIWIFESGRDWENSGTLGWSNCSPHCRSGESNWWFHGRESKAPRAGIFSMVWDGLVLFSFRNWPRGDLGFTHREDEEWAEANWRGRVDAAGCAGSKTLLYLLGGFQPPWGLDAQWH